MVGVGFHKVIPSDALAGVGGVAAEEAEGGGVGYVFKSVHFLARAEGGEEFVVFDLIHVVLNGIGLRAPNCFAGFVLDCAAAGGEHSAFFAENFVGDIGVATDEVALTDVGEDAVRIFVGDVVVVVDVSAIFAGDFSAVGNGCDWGDVAHGPCDFVDSVDALFHEGACGEVLEIEPPANLPFYVAHAFGFDGILWNGFDGAG